MPNLKTVDGNREGPGRDVMATSFDDGFSRYDAGSRAGGPSITSAPPMRCRYT